MHKVLKLIVHIAAATFGSLAIIFAVASWRLSSGPISIGFLSPYIEEAFESEDLSYRLEFEDTILTWAGWNRSLDILITDAHAVGPEGEVLASVPKISLGLSALSLLKGQIAPTSVELLHPEVHLVRNLDGGLEFAFGSEFEEPDETVNELIADFLAAPGTDHPLGQLKRISILSAALRVDDELLDLSWNAPEADLIFDLYSDRIDGELLADIEVADVALRVVAATAFERANGKVHTNIQFGEVVPAKLAAISPKLDALNAFKLPISGALEFTLNQNGSLTDRISFDLAGGAGSLMVPKILPAPPNIASLRLQGDADANFDTLNLASLFIDTGGPTFNFSGQLSGISDQTAISGTFEFTEMPFDDLKNYWPDTLMTNARSWILGNVFDGVLSNFTVDFDIKPGEIDLVQSGARPNAIDVDFSFRDATVNYFPEQPYAFGVDGEGHVDGASLSMNMRDGTIENMYAPSGVALITDLMLDSAMLTIIANVEGPADNAISLLDGPRFGYPSKMGLKGEQFSGHVIAEMGVQLPFRSDVTFEEVQFAAVARLDDLNVRDLFGDYDVSNGQMRLTLDENNMEVGGSIAVEGMPAEVKWIENFSPQAPFQSRYDISAVLDQQARETFGVNVAPFASGPFDMNFTYTVSPDGAQHIAAALGAEDALIEIPELFWEKPIGERASILVLARLEDHKNVEVTNFELNSMDLRVKGRAEIGPQHGNLISAELSSVQLGDNDVTVSYKRDADDNIVLDVGGKSLDLRPYIKQLRDTDQDNLPPFILEANVERLITRADQQITDARARAVNTAERLESAILIGTLTSGSEFRLVLEPDGAAKRRLVVRSNDAGSVARAFNIYDDVIGGSLVLDATIHDDQPGAPVEGEVRIEDYKVINAPTLAQILAVASFTGIFDALQGEGITFSNFHLPFSLKDGIVTVERAQTAGFSIGVNASGKVNLDNGRVDMRGTIVPAYALNSILGNIPLIGDLLVGGEGEGIFAATFSVKGTTEEPKVTVNPLAALAPGFLRNLFSIFDGESDVTGDEVEEPEIVQPRPETNR
ncbi:MAG: hypothetical protein HOM52_17910 [Rhodospirillaceae bacterium]|nr:hypothetical protein [Rhodospirillaceae bacterium]MBT5779906.1 hypothetical protein [Rhodospirillaceae bacterium]